MPHNARIASAAVLSSRCRLCGACGEPQAQALHHELSHSLKSRHSVTVLQVMAITTS